MSRIVALMGVSLSLSYPCVALTNNQTIGMAVGYYATQDFESFPLLALSKNQGIEWFYPSDIFSKFPSDASSAYFRTSSCNTHFCVGVGDYWKRLQGRTLPFMTVSQDQGDSWTYLTKFPIELEMNQFEISASSCNSTMCVVSFTYQQNGFTVPFMAVSHNKGNFWEFSSIRGETRLEDLNIPGLDCTDKICVAVGGSRVPSAAYIAVSKDQARTWSSVKLNLPPAYQEASLHSVKCKENSCIAVGNYGNGNDIITLRSQDRGDTWSLMFTGYKPDVGISRATHVTYHGNTWIISGIKHQDGKQVPLVLVSQDNGLTWSEPSSVISYFQHENQSIEISGVSCEDQFCAFPIYSNKVNTKKSQFIFAIAISEDNGTNWSYVDVSPANARGGYLGNMQCSKDNCFVAGYIIDESYENKPFVLVSNDHGKTWYSPQSIISQLPSNFESGKFFNAAVV